MQTAVDSSFSVNFLLCIYLVDPEINFIRYLSKKKSSLASLPFLAIYPPAGGCHFL